MDEKKEEVVSKLERLTEKQLLIIQAIVEALQNYNANK